PGFFAQQNTRTPVRIGIIAMVANMVFNLLLVWHYRHVGLALATAASAWLNAGLLWRGLRKQGIYQPGSEWRFLLPRIVFAVLLMGVLVHWMAGLTDVWTMGAAFERAYMLLAIVALGGATYIGSLVLLCFLVRHLKR